MRRASDNFRNSGAYTSPGTPEYGNNNNHAVDLPKTWSSEHGPLLPHSRRHFNSMAASLTPFNNGRKPLPSKWDDAERWITSPISGYNVAFKNPSSIPQRRPKSKSGPLGPTPAGEGGNKVRNFMINSPLTTGVLLPEGFSVRFDEGSASAKSSSFYAEDSVMRRETSMPTSQDDKVERCNEDEVSSLVLGEASRRDMGTQMSHEGSSRSSCNERLSFSALPSSSTVPFSGIERCNSKDEVRDVQIDESVTELKHCKEQGLMKRGKKKEKDSSRNVGESPFPWNASEGSIHRSMLQREEAKITAWENLQKAKAEADIRKLEMKLEKKRSSSMEKIMKKLRAKQAKAQTMRESFSVSDRKAHETNRRRESSRRRTSLSNCFTCRIF